MNLSDNKGTVNERRMRCAVRCSVCDDLGCEFCPKVRELDELATRRQEQVDRLAGGGLPPVWDEAGTVDVRLVCAGVAVAVLALVVWLAWPYLVGTGVIVAAWRVATRSTRRRRPRSSWSSLGRTAAAMYAAWNSRWLKGPMLRASIPAAAGREQAPCGECGRDEPIPF